MARVHPHDIGRGFTLLEVLVALAVVAVLGAALAPLAVYGRAQLAAQTTLKDLQAGGAGLAGDPDQGDSGFLGDLGRVPTVSELSAPGALATAQVSGVASVGWRGPYAPFQTSAPLDGWGNPYGVTADGRLHSAGPDGAMGTADDLYAPAAGAVGAAGPLASVCLEVVVVGRRGRLGALNGSAGGGAPQSLAQAQIYVPGAGGAASWLRPGAATASCSFPFSSVPPGRRLVTATGLGAAANLSGWAYVWVAPSRPSAATIRLEGAT